MDTRDRFLDAATALFAERGYYGASMDQIAREVGLTKQALIHHFGRKEKLYGAVLERISTPLLEAIPEPDATADPQAALSDALESLLQHSLSYGPETQLLMRELLDNRRRAAQAGIWYLKPFLDRLQALQQRCPAWRQASAAQIAAQVYALLGAISYFAISFPTLEHMYSAAQVAAMRAEFPARLRALAGLEPPPA